MAVKTGSKLHVHNAMRKYTDEIEYDVLFEGSVDDVYTMEAAYRPLANTAWNAAIGGYKTIGATNSKEITLFHKDSIDVLHTFESYTEASDKLGLPLGRIQQAAFRNKCIFGFDGWAVLVDKTIDRSTVMSVQEQLSINNKGVKKRYPNMFKGTTGRWSEEQKRRIGSYHKGKKLSKEHVEILKTKNRKNSKCREITLKHKDSDTTYTYFSISEASRELDIPLPRLKSKVTRPLGNYGKDGWAVIALGSE